PTSLLLGTAYAVSGGARSARRVGRSEVPDALPEDSGRDEQVVHRECLGPQFAGAHIRAAAGEVGAQLGLRHAGGLASLADSLTHLPGVCLSGFRFRHASSLPHMRQAVNPYRAAYVAP